MSLCGKQFSATDEVWKDRRATCPTCLKLDNPFDLSAAQTVKFWRTSQYLPDMNLSNVEDLVKRDLINSTTRQVTCRGEVLARDLKEHPPWADEHGVVHARNAIARKRGVCGADLVGIDTMTYVQLDRLHAVATGTRVTCIECMVT
jgi:hypothetical protein